MGPSETGMNPEAYEWAGREMAVMLERRMELTREKTSMDQRNGMPIAYTLEDARLKSERFNQITDELCALDGDINQLAERLVADGVPSSCYHAIEREEGYTLFFQLKPMASQPSSYCVAYDLDTSTPEEATQS